MELNGGGGGAGGLTECTLNSSAQTTSAVSGLSDIILADGRRTLRVIGDGIIMVMAVALLLRVAGFGPKIL